MAAAVETNLTRYSEPEAVDPRAEHKLYTVFKRNIGTTVTVAILLTIVLYFVSPAIAVAVGIATALLIGWWIYFIING